MQGEDLTGVYSPNLLRSVIYLRKDLKKENQKIYILQLRNKNKEKRISI